MDGFAAAGVVLGSRYVGQVRAADVGVGVEGVGATQTGHGVIGGYGVQHDGGGSGRSGGRNSGGVTHDAIDIDMNMESVKAHAARCVLGDCMLLCCAYSC